ncbi:MAG: phosphatidylserine decarboxylase family protein [Syntrophobacterales bacterium]|nr:phosphatidylserine decarboxylase family protein [Syntrophobacterales bacterium]
MKAQYHIFDNERDRIPVTKEGYPFIFLGVLFTVTMALLDMAICSILGFVLTAFILYFFRDPQRIVPADPKLIVAPADGFIIDIKEVSPPEIESSNNVPYRRISIFMTVFDVHVNRAPCSGKILRVHHESGKFMAAQKPNAPLQNERNTVVMETAQGERIVIVQVAGLIARRIVFWHQEGSVVHKGERIGMIRFGSRVDLYIPTYWEIKISRGQRVRAGETVVCITT